MFTLFPAHSLLLSEYSHSGGSNVESEGDEMCVGVWVGWVVLVVVLVVMMVMDRGGWVVVVVGVTVVVVVAAAAA
jgi:hypothetical protein